MATWRGNQRQLLDAIGIEGDGNFDLSDDVVLTAPSFDSIKAYGAFGGTRLLTSSVPTAVALRNAGIFIQAPIDGCWLNCRNSSGNNLAWSTFRPGEGAIFVGVTQLSGPAFNSEAPGSANTFWGGTQAVPDPSRSLLVAISGDTAAALGRGFIIGSSTLFGGPIWMPPFTAFQATFVAQNVTGIIDLDIFVPDERRTPQ